MPFKWIENKVRLVTTLIWAGIALLGVLFVCKYCYPEYSARVDNYSTLLMSLIFLLAFFHALFSGGIYLRGHIDKKDDAPYIYYSFLVGYFATFIVLLARFIKQ